MDAIIHEITKKDANKITIVEYKAMKEALAEQIGILQYIDIMLDYEEILKMLSVEAHESIFVTLHNEKTASEIAVACLRETLKRVNEQVSLMSNRLA